MRPLRIYAHNYRSYRELDLDLPQGCIAVIGTNGAGKSSLVQTIDLALFGPEGRSLADYRSDLAGDGELMRVEVEFEHAGRVYRVRREYHPAGRGRSLLDLEVAGDAGWEPLTRETQAATQERLEQILGLRRSTFRASSFLAQGDGAAFTETSPAERKRILAQALGLDLWERLCERARADRRQAEAQHERLVAERDLHAGEAERLDELEQREIGLRQAELAAQAEVERAEARYRELADRLAASERRLGERQAVEAQLAAARERLRHAQAELERLETAVSDREEAQGRLAELPADMVDEAEADLDALRARMAEYERELARWEKLRDQREAAIAERERIAREAADLRSRAQALRSQAETLLSAGPGASRCDRCGQTLGEEALRMSIRSLEAEAAEIDARSETLDAEVAAITIPDVPAQPVASVDDDQIAAAQQRLQYAQEVRLERARLHERLAQTNAVIGSLDRGTLRERSARAAAEIGALESRLAELEATDVAQARRDFSNAEHDLDEARRRREGIAAALASLGVELERARQARERLADAERRSAEIRAEIELLCALERAYGRDGIPAMIVETVAIPQIEAEANRILAELGSEMRIELRTIRELKGGGQADALDIVLVGGAGVARPYETFSGGEKTRINLALRIALARLLSHRQGAESRLLVIDEPEYLDEAGTEALAAVLRDLVGEFETILLVSHMPTLRDSFDYTILVTRMGDWSSVEGARATEGVPAA